jgi:hypothetical protein
MFWLPFGPIFFELFRIGREVGKARGVGMLVMMKNMRIPRITSFLTHPR